MAESADGILWIATKGGLNRYNRKAGTFTLVSHKEADALLAAFWREKDGIASRWQ
jgi:ligand-binding sensor domain-containing protein